MKQPEQSEVRRSQSQKRSSSIFFYLFILLSFYIFSPTAFSQQLKADGVTSLAADRQGSCYVVTGNGVAKYNAKLELQSRYTTSFGKIENVDALDPFKVLVFCKQFLRVFLLDNKLSVLGNPIFLPDVNILKPSAVCRSAENGMWVADAYRQQLLYLDFTLNTTREAASLASYTSGGKQPATYMVERGNKLFVNFSGKNIAVFDKFGAPLHLFSLNADAWFDVYEQTIYYLSEKKLYAQNMSSWSEPPRLLASNVDCCALTGEAVYTIQNGVLTKLLVE